MSDGIKKHSLKKRFILSVVLLIVLTLLLAIGLVAHHSYQLYKRDLTENADMVANMLATNLAPALLFDDHDAAREAFYILVENPQISAVMVYDLHKNVIADYPVGFSLEHTPEHHFLHGTQLNDDFLEIIKPVNFYDKHVGTIWMRFELDVLYERLQHYKVILLVSFFISLTFALLLIALIRSYFEKPINRLMETARQVTEFRNYRERIPHDRHDEFGTLFDAFNNMMQVIEDRDKQLLEHSENLEQIIEVRTEQINYRANYDALTNLPNRYLLLDRLKQAINSARHKGDQLALLYLDLDRFKFVNDNLGHIVGDKLLQAVSERLQFLLDSDITISRLGGDEFIVLIEHVENRQNVEKVAKSIIHAFREPFNVLGHNLHITTSIGIALYPEDGLDETSMMAHADVSMYQAKNSGKATYAFYEADFERDAQHVHSMETDLHEALSKDQFLLMFQPIHQAHTLELVGFETLLRWQRNSKHLVMPDQFIPLANEIGVMRIIERWVLLHVFEFINTLKPHLTKPLQFSINLSPSNLKDAKFSSIFTELIRSHEIDPAWIELEITEESFLEATDDVLEHIAELKALGVSIAVDDYGTGYSSLSYLKDYPVDTLKLDASFVRDLQNSPSSQGIVSSTIPLAHKLGMTMVAEGVENKQQLRFLQAQNCDRVQGHYFSVPLSLEEVLPYLRAHSSRAASQ